MCVWYRQIRLGSRAKWIVPDLDKRESAVGKGAARFRRGATSNPFAMTAEKPCAPDTDRRRFLRGAASFAAGLAVEANAVGAAGMLANAASLEPLEVAYAGSMAPVMGGPIRTAVAQALNVELRGRAQGALALANLIAADSIRPDVFIAVTQRPMRIVLAAGKTAQALPFARTEMVLAYSLKSRFAAAFASVDRPEATPWPKVLKAPGLRFGRTDPRTDPQGLNIIFVMELAARYYRDPELVARVLGPTINPSQIFAETEMMARLQAGQLDVSSAYRIQPQAFGLPFITLAPEVNLGDPRLASEYQAVAVTLERKTYRPEPLVYYVAALKAARDPALAARFVQWLTGMQARAILKRAAYQDAEDAAPLSA
jgi:molybdate/tungstate transport system substrate-binding protein